MIQVFNSLSYQTIHDNVWNTKCLNTSRSNITHFKRVNVQNVTFLEMYFNTQFNLSTFQLQ